MTYEEAISELVVIKSVFSHMRGEEYKPCVEALQMAIDLLRQADTPQTSCDGCKYEHYGASYHCDECCRRWEDGYTPQTETQTKTQNSNLTFEKANTLQTDIPSRNELGDCNSCEYLGDLRCGMCTNGSGYRRADTPQTEDWKKEMMEDDIRADCPWK